MPRPKNGIKIVHPALKREVRFSWDDHVPIIATTNLTTLNGKAPCSSSLVLLSAAVSVERGGGESRGCLSSELDASFAIGFFCTREVQYLKNRFGAGGAWEI